MIKLFRCCFISTLTLSVIWIQAQPKHSFSIQQCVTYAKKNSVQVKNALLGLQIQEQSNRVITASALPNLSAQGNITDNVKIATQLLPGEFFGQPPGSFIPVKFGTKYVANGGVTLNQLLFDGQVFVGLQARRASLDLQQKNIEVTEETIKKNIYKIYYQLLVSEEQIKLIEANQERINNLLHDVSAMYKNGFAEKIDIDKLDVQLTNLQTQKTSVVTGIEKGYLGLKVLMGMPLKDTLLLTESITEEKLKEVLLDNDTGMYIQRKEYQYLSVAHRMRQFNVRRYKLSYIPTLSLSANYNYNAQRTKFDFLQGGQWFPNAYVTLRVNVPIFDGFAKNANLQQAKLELQQSQNNLENLQLNINNEIQQAKYSYQSSVQTIDFQKKNMALAEQVYNQTRKKYQVGTGSSTEITAAQTDLIQAQTNYINALYEAIIAKTDYLAAIGKLQ